MTSTGVDASQLVGLNSRERVYRATRGWRLLDVREIWQFRELLYFMAWRDVKIRYKQTVLGALWAILQPAMYMVLFTIVFGRLAHIPSENAPYPVFVYAGLLPWSFVSTSVTNASQSLVNNAHLITKIYFPRLIVPLGTVGAALVDMASGLVLLVWLMWRYHVAITPWLMLVPFLVILSITIAVAAGAALSALTVTYRDFRYVVPFGVQVWMYATPVVYPAALVPPQWRALLWLNPMAGVVEALRAAVLGRVPDWSLLGSSVIGALVLFAMATGYFARVERQFVDVV
jgi:lipopolysaccharide transport system permease protein